MTKMTSRALPLFIWVLAFELFSMSGCGVAQSFKKTSGAEVISASTFKKGLDRSAGDPQFASVQSVLAMSCVPCHASQVPSFILGGDAAANRQTLLDTLRLSESPAQNWILLKATNEVSHGGGVVLSSTSSGYQSLLSWIEAQYP